MTKVWVLYLLGVGLGAAAGFFSPVWYLGFLPLAAGLIWAAYDLIEVTDGESAPESRRRA